jgi:hypothetical protein
MLATQNATSQAAPIGGQVDTRRAIQLHTLGHYSQEQQAAAHLLFTTGQQMLDTGGGGTCGRLLLGIYNGRRFPFDLTDLRRLDDARHAAAMTVLHMDSRRTYVEIHTLLDAILAVPSDKSTGNTLEVWAHRMGLKGRCKKEYLAETQARAV